MWNYLSTTTPSATASGPSRWGQIEDGPCLKGRAITATSSKSVMVLPWGRAIPPVRNRINDSAGQGKRSAAQPGGRSKLRS